MPTPAKWMWLILGSVATVALSSACGDDDDNKGGGKGGSSGCTPGEQSICAVGQVCEEVVGGEPSCFEPLVVTGQVFDLISGDAIEGARVVARDDNLSAISSVAITAADGTYELTVPAPRDAEGNPQSETFTLRADAADYQSFPTPPRVALPIDTADAEADAEKGGYGVANATTDIGLIALPDTSGLGTVSGTVISEAPKGTLVVAGGATGIADADGAFTVFNVPAGDVSVEGYIVNVNFDPATATVAAGEESIGVELIANEQAGNIVSGSVQIVNAPGGSQTSVVLALEDTFNETAIRGEVPPGLRAANVDGSWAIAGVPDGRYVVLAAFENDDLVRDPDTSIGGTDIVRITVDGGAIELAEGFKVTEALDVVSPGANGIEIVNGDITFTWQDDSSEDEYNVVVFDALGELVWETTGDFDPGGNSDATVDYGGPALMPGMIYQFRATSIKDGVPISSTEDLKGVFQFE